MDRDRTLQELVEADRLNQPLKPYERFRLEDAREKGKVRDKIQATDFVASQLHTKPIDPRAVHQKKQIDQKRAVAGWQNAASKAKIKGISGAPMDAPDRIEDEKVSLDRASVEAIPAPFVYPFPERRAAAERAFAEQRAATERAFAAEDRQITAACAVSAVTAYGKNKEDDESSNDEEDTAEPNVRFEIQECIYLKSFWTPDMEKYVLTEEKYLMSGALNAKYAKMIKRLPKIYTGGSDDGDDDSDDSDSSNEYDYEVSDEGSVNVDAMSNLKEKGSSSSFSGALSYQGEGNSDDSDDDEDDTDDDDDDDDTNDDDELDNGIEGDDEVDGGVKLINFDP